MALRVWLPLNGNLNNNGLSPVTVTNNGASVNDAGKIGKCYSFNSTPIYGTLTGLSGWNKFSASCWVYLPQHRGSQYMFHFGGQDGWMAKFGVYTAATTGNIYLLINGVEVNSQKSLSVNTWNHITVTFDGSKLILYLNGVSAFSYTATGTFSASDHFAIGARTNSTSGTTFNYPILDNGKLNDIRIYDHCLSPREVKEISRGLVLHYKLDDPYIEPTENLNSADWVPYQAYWTIVSQTQNEIKLRKNTLTGSTNTVALKNNVLRGKIATNQTVTISGYLYKGDTPYKTGRDKPTTYGGWTKISAYSDDTGYFRFTGYFTSAMTFDWLFHETLFGTGNQDGDICYIRNLQWEAKDHATPYTPSSRSGVPVYDCSGYRNNGTPNGALTLSDDSSRYDKSTSVSNGNAISTTTVPFTALTDCTISFWLYLQSRGTSGWLPFSGQTNQYYILATTSGTGAFYHSNVGSNTKVIYRDGVVGSTPLSSGQWHHYCITGVDLSTWTLFSINNYQQGTNWNFTGNLSDFRIYSTALSADDVKELYNTSALIHNDGTIEAFEFVETASGSPEVTKTGLVKAQKHVEQPTLCEYLQADGNSWINTLIPYDSTKDTYRIECKFSQPSNVSSYDAVFGAYNGENSKCLRIIRGNSNSILWVCYNTKAGGGNPLSLSGTNSDIKEVVITSTTVKVTVGGTTSTYNIPTKVSANNMTGTFYLFSQKDTSSRSKSIIYYFRLYDGDTLLCNMVPCILNGVPGMWDIVGSKFYGNDGTGTFTTGAQQTTVASLFANKTIANQIIES